MANIIEIVIHATDAATAQIKGVQGAVAGMSASMSGLLSTVMSPAGLAAGFALAGVAAVGLGNSLSKQIEELTNLSARTGASINDLRALRQVMVEAGQSQEALTTSLTIANRNLATQAAALEKVGITAKTPIEALLQLSDMVTRSGNSSKTTAAAFALLGRGGGELIPILNGLRPALESMHDRLGDLSQDTIDAAKRWDEMIDRMGTSIKSFLDGTGGAFLRWWDKIMKSNSTLDPKSWAFMFKGGQALPREAFPGFDIKPSVGETAPPDPFALMRLNFGDTGAGDVQRRGGAAATAAQWKQLMDVWNDAEPVAKNLAKAIEEIDLGLQALEFGVQSLAFGFLDFFDAVVFRGINAADALREAFMSTIRDIGNELAKIGIGLGLTALGTALGGPLGGAIGTVGGRLAGLGNMGRGRGGDTYIINTLDTRTLRTSLMPGGSLNRAGDQLHIGAHY